MRENKLEKQGNTEESLESKMEKLGNRMEMLGNIQVMMGIARNVVQRAPIDANQPGQLPATPVSPSNR